MATKDYTGLNNTATRLLTKFGTTYELRREGSSGTWTKKYNPVTGEIYWDDGAGGTTTPPAETIITDTGLCVIDNFESEEIDGTSIKRSDKKLVAKGTIKPQPGDTFTVAGVVYEFVNVLDIAPDGNSIIFEIQVRI